MYEGGIRSREAVIDALKKSVEQGNINAMTLIVETQIMRMAPSTDLVRDMTFKAMRLGCSHATYYHALLFGPDTRISKYRIEVAIQLGSVQAMRWMALDLFETGDKDDRKRGIQIARKLPIKMANEVLDQVDPAI
jgi:hypothetical protein